MPRAPGWRARPAVRRAGVSSSVSSPAPAVPQPGQVVRVRSRQYLVEDGRPAARPQASRPSSASPASTTTPRAQELEVLWEKEVDAQVLSDDAWSAGGHKGFDEPRLFSAYLNTLRWNCVTATDPRLFQSPFRAGIQVDAYQLEPLRKALLLPRVNLFIADDVGLGKTIEAGLIVRELLMRQKVRRIVVACPPSVLLQWRDELEQPLRPHLRGLRPRVRRSTSAGSGASASTPGRRTPASSSRTRCCATRPTPARSATGWATSPPARCSSSTRPTTPPRPAARKYAIDSQLTRAVRDLAPRFEHRLFLSATPHNGHSNSFSALLEILDPQRFCRGVPVKGPKLLDDGHGPPPQGGPARDRRAASPSARSSRSTSTACPADAPELRARRGCSTSTPTCEPSACRTRTKTRAGRGRARHRLACRSGCSPPSRPSRARSRSTAGRSRRPRPSKARTRRSAGDPQSRSASSRAPPGRRRRAGRPGRGGGRGRKRTPRSRPRRGAAAGGEARPAPRPRARAPRRDDAHRRGRAPRPDARVPKLVDWIRDEPVPRPADRQRPAAVAARLEPRAASSIFTEYADTKRYLEQQLRAAIAGTDRADRAHRAPSTAAWARTPARRSSAPSTPTRRSTRCAS